MKRHEGAIKRVAVLTSGGDAPGMNAAIRAVVRCAIDRGWQVLGVRHGYAGLLQGEFEPLDSRAVSAILQQGGTFLGTSRCLEFQFPDGAARASEKLSAAEIDALVVIGGNGSQAGTLSLARAGLSVVGVPSTIDNDLVGSDLTIGVDTALNVAIEATDRLKTTASSYERLFLVEVMGRQSGYLALATGLAAGAEVVVVPETHTSPEEVEQKLRTAYENGKRFGLVVVAEGAQSNANALARYFNEAQHRIGFQMRVTILGHVQRGGTPTAADRLLATSLGAAAVSALADGEAGTLVGLVDGRMVRTPLEEVVGKTKPLPPELLALAPILAR